MEAVPEGDWFCPRCVTARAAAVGKQKGPSGNNGEVKGSGDQAAGTTAAMGGAGAVGAAGEKVSTCAAAVEGLTVAAGGTDGQMPALAAPGYATATATVLAPATAVAAPTMKMKNPFFMRPEERRRVAAETAADAARDALRALAATDGVNAAAIAAATATAAADAAADVGRKVHHFFALQKEKATAVRDAEGALTLAAAAGVSLRGAVQRKYVELHSLKVTFL
jgi:hypothetical protein